MPPLGDAARYRHPVEEWREGANRRRLWTYAALLQLAAVKGYGRAWSDTFLMSVSHGEKEDAEPGPARPLSDRFGDENLLPVATSGRGA